MRARDWAALIALLEESDALCDALAGRLGLTKGATDPSALADAARALDELHRELRARFQSLIDGLRAGALAPLSESERRAIATALVFLLNERVRRRLPPEHRGDWVLLQVNEVRVEYGGMLFYELVDRASDERSPIVNEVLYFCLSHGFEGKLRGDPAAISEYRQRIRRHVPIADHGWAPTEAPRAARSAPPPALFYAASGATVVTLYSVLCWMSN